MQRVRSVVGYRSKGVSRMQGLMQGDQLSVADAGLVSMELAYRATCASAPSTFRLGNRPTSLDVVCSEPIPWTGHYASLPAIFMVGPMIDWHEIGGTVESMVARHTDDDEEELDAEEDGFEDDDIAEDDFEEGLDDEGEDDDLELEEEIDDLDDYEDEDDLFEDDEDLESDFDTFDDDSEFDDEDEDFFDDED